MYETFELLATGAKIVKGQGQKRVSFEVRVPRSPAGEIIQGIPSGYDAREMARCFAGWEDQSPEWPAVIQAGDWLASLLFPGKALEFLVRSLDIVKASGKKLRLRLMLEGAVQNAPWEYALVNRGGGETTPMDFLALSPDVSIVRHPAAGVPAQAVEARLPARLLVALASPFGLGSINLEREQKVVADAIGGKPNIQPIFKVKAMLADLLKDAGQVHMFHFVGHGIYRRQENDATGAAEGEAVLAFEDGFDDPDEVKASDLAIQLRSAGVRVAVLGACQSAQQGDTNMWSGAATALLKAELSAVVGMQFKVRENRALAFFGAFYDRLVSGLTIDEAVTAGRIGMAQKDPFAWGIPVLYLRANEGVIFSEYAQNPGLEVARKQLRASVSQEIDILRGSVTGIKVKTISRGELSVDQKARVVEKGSQLTGLEADSITGGSIDVNQKGDEVKGDVTGLKLDSLG